MKNVYIHSNESTSMYIQKGKGMDILTTRGRPSGPVMRHVNITVPPELWKQFRMACLENDRSASDVLSAYMEVYVGGKGEAGCQPGWGIP